MTTLPYVVLSRSQNESAHGLSFTVDSMTVEVFGTLPELKALGERLVRYAERGCWQCGDGIPLTPGEHWHEPRYAERVVGRVMSERERPGLVLDDAPEQVKAR